MFDATKLLGGFMQGRGPGGGFGGKSGGALGGMLGQALSQLGGSRGGGGGGGMAGGLGGGLAGGLAGGLGGLLSQFGGGAAKAGATPAAPGAGGGFMDQVGELTRRAVAAPGTELRGNNPVAVGGLGALAGAFMDGGKGAVGGGLLAVLGSLAYSAYQNQGQNQGQNHGQAGAAPQAGTLPALQAYSDPAEVQRKAQLMLRAMIQATKADGHLDDAESERLTRHLDDSGDPDAQTFLREEMARPVDIDGLAASVRSPEEGAEVYGASVLAISVDTQAERDYLARLATALKLPPEVVSHVQAGITRTA